MTLKWASPPCRQLSQHISLDPGKKCQELSEWVSTHARGSASPELQTLVSPGAYFPYTLKGHVDNKKGSLKSLSH